MSGSDSPQQRYPIALRSSGKPAVRREIRAVGHRVIDVDWTDINDPAADAALVGIVPVPPRIHSPAVLSGPYASSPAVEAYSRQERLYRPGCVLSVIV